MAERLARLEARAKEMDDKDNIRVIIADATYGRPIVIDFRDPETFPWRATSRPSKQPNKTRREALDTSSPLTKPSKVKDSLKRTARLDARRGKRTRRQAV
jgi:hypothetical protein